MTDTLTFQQITPELATGAEPPAWQPIIDLPLVILVGVTGVGKSTLLAQLGKQGMAHRLLPNRRALTDRLIIAQMQVDAGEPVAQVTDRRQRFAYTRAYRARYPGGMAHALAQLWVAANASPTCWIFDGLRGANEVTAAAAELPQVRFVMLDAPDLVRVQRLLGRNDAFDHVDGVTQTTASSDVGGYGAGGYDLPEAAGLLRPAEIDQLAHWAARQAIAPDEVRAKLQIVAEERRNYNPAATLDALRAHAPVRTLHLDTVAHTPAELARASITWLNEQSDSHTSYQ